MGVFSASTYENDVERATSEQNTKENWAHIMDVCDKAKRSPEEARNYLRVILKRLNNSDPHIGLQAATLLDSCVNNCGKVFHLEVASREFENEYLKLISKVHPKLAKTLNLNLKRWAEEDFKTDSQLILIPTLYSKLVEKGFDFTLETSTKKVAPMSKDPNVVESQEEQDQIAKAIELSLKDSEGPKTQATTSLYPTTSIASSSLFMATTPKESKKVRALYDFEAVEDNELTFSSGDIIIVTDDSDPNWWRGSNSKGEGLFPASFVTSDLSIEPEQLLLEKQKKVSQLDEALVGKASALKEPEVTEINEQKIDRLLHLLHEADPTNPEHDTEEMLSLEREVNNMGPLIDSELERVDRKHAQLTKLSSDLVEALNLYHTLMREPQTQSMTKMPPYGYMDMHHPHPPPMAYNGMFPPNMPRDMMNPMPPPSAQHNQMDNRSFMPPHVGPPSMPPHNGPPSMPPHFPSLPPSAGGAGMPPHSMNPLPQHIPDDRIPTFPNQGMPNYGAVNMPQGFPPQMPPTNMHQQNGNPMVIHYPPPQQQQQPPNNSHM